MTGECANCTELRARIRELLAIRDTWIDRASIEAEKRREAVENARNEGVKDTLAYIAEFARRCDSDTRMLLEDFLLGKARAALLCVEWDDTRIQSMTDFCRSLLCFMSGGYWDSAAQHVGDWMDECGLLDDHSRAAWQKAKEVVTRVFCDLDERDQLAAKVTEQAERIEYLVRQLAKEETKRIERRSK